MDTYTDFLQTKIIVSERSGFDVDVNAISWCLMDHQTDAVQWALRLGRALVAMSFGLGKTRIQIELARLIHERTGKRFLVVCPLAVKQQFQYEDGPTLGTEWEYVRTDDEIARASSPYLITNYERVRDGDIDPRKHDFAGVSLDEGSVLRSLGTKTAQIFKDVFHDVPYRFVCTATPAPNDYKELIYFAEFLDVMDHGQALTRFFKRDPQKAGHLLLMPSQEEKFWLWVASWALFVSRPSDLGYSDEGFDLPSLNIHWERISVDVSRGWDQVDNRGQRRLYPDAANGIHEAVAEKRATMPDRVARARQIIEQHPDRHWLVWHHLEDERRLIEKTIPNVTSVFGSQPLELREQRILDFSHGAIDILATKPEIAGSGCNFQRYCYSNIFVGVDYKFQDFIQAIYRTNRFLQTHPVDVWIIYAESEDNVVSVLKRKWQQYDVLIEKMRAIIKTYGLSQSALRSGLSRSMGVDRMELKSKHFTAIHNDCVLEIANLPDNSVDMIHTSIPFGNHYEYSTQFEDFGYNPTDDHFWKQMDYLIPQLLRVIKPGRVAAIHVKDRILYGHQTPHGFMEIEPFSAQCIFAFQRNGWLFEGQRTIVTDVVRENASTYRLGWTAMTEDATKMGSGLPEYLLLFRKQPTSSVNQRADEPVTKSKSDYSRARWQIDAHSFWRSNGNGLMLPAELYDYETHVARLEEQDRLGHLPADYFSEPPVSPVHWVWDDVVYMRTLNSQQSAHREENHICPLPFDIVERTIRLYSNPGDVILDPFAGIFTVPYLAIKHDRYGIGIELNRDYYNAGVRYCRQMEEQIETPTLFDYLESLGVLEIGEGKDGAKKVVSHD